jgi:hypothetical protein
MSISQKIRRLIERLVRAASHHHQPSRFIAVAAATILSATWSKSASV